ncbi:MAG: class B sortase [Lachnospiraceae bacterium]
MSNHNNRKRHINEEKRKQHMEQRKKKNKRTSKGRFGLVSTIILILAIGVFIYSAVQLFSIFSEYHQGKKEYDQIKTLAIKEKDKDKKTFSVDFNALKEINPDIVAWIRFDEPAEISYPVVQGKDNAEYLHRTFQENDNKLGTLFVDVGNAADFTGKNTFIYGHNMKNGTMFAKLLEYKQTDFYNQHPFFYIYTPDGKATKYKVCSAAVIKDDSELYRISYDTTEAWMEYLNLMKQTSSNKEGIVFNESSQLVSLSTCTNVADNERFLVQGVKIGKE